VTKTTELADRAPSIRVGGPPLIVAELSGNHNGSIERAFALIEAAKKAGAHAVKFQTYTADTLTIDHKSPQFVLSGGLWDGRTLYDLYQEASTPWDWHPALFAKARELGLIAFSTPFDPTAVDFLESLDCPWYKIASFEIIDLPLIKKAASTGKPLIMSTGIANLGEIQEAVDAASHAGCKELVLLHCISAYPAKVEDSNLLTLTNLRETFGVPVGLSDHTLGTAVAVASVALGACIVEKHMTLARADGGPDAAFSLEPREFSTLVQDCRAAYYALGRVHYAPKGCESVSATLRRSLYFVADIDEGELITRNHVRSIRPGFGISPKYLEDVIGSRSTARILRGTPVSWKLFKEK
jgi:N-acetylneuraminate synthase